MRGGLGIYVSFTYPDTNEMVAQDMEFGESLGTERTFDVMRILCPLPVQSFGYHVLPFPSPPAVVELYDRRQFMKRRTRLRDVHCERKEPPLTQQADVKFRRY